MDLKDRIQKVIDQRRATLLKERDRYEEKMRDTMSFYGVGGAYRRQTIRIADDGQAWLEMLKEATEE